MHNTRIRRFPTYDRVSALVCTHLPPFLAMVGAQTALLGCAHVRGLLISQRAVGTSCSPRPFPSLATASLLPAPASALFRLFVGSLESHMLVES